LHKVHPVIQKFKEYTKLLHINKSKTCRLIGDKHNCLFGFGQSYLKIKTDIDQFLRLLLYVQSSILLSFLPIIDNNAIIYNKSKILHFIMMANSVALPQLA
jgi:hypothetical protein